MSKYRSSNKNSNKTNGSKTNGSKTNGSKKYTNNNKNYTKKYGHNNNNSNKQNGKNDNFNDPSIREKLVKYIFKNIKLSDYDYTMIENTTHLDPLNDKKFYVSPNFNGINCLLVFNRYGDHYYSYLIYCQTLKYDFDKIKISDVKIYPINVRLNKNIYKGTIIDGVVLNNTKKNVFVINDVYTFKGENMKKNSLYDKILNINTYLEVSYKKDNLVNDLDLVTNTIHPLKSIERLINRIIPENSLKDNIKGITFMPKISNTKLVYLYSNYDSKKIKESKEEVLIKPVDIKVAGSISAIFKMVKTKETDVYELYLCRKILDNGKKNVKYIKKDIAYLPTIATSKLCCDIFNTINRWDTLVECKYHNRTARWIPFKHIVNKKYPDTVKKVNSKIQ
jgi:hypothetical protein